MREEEETRNMEGRLEAYFAAERDRLNAPADLWARLEPRLDSQPRPSWWAGLLGGLSGARPQLATAVAAVLLLVGGVVTWRVILPQGEPAPATVAKIESAAAPEAAAEAPVASGAREATAPEAMAAPAAAPSAPAQTADAIAPVAAQAPESLEGQTPGFPASCVSRYLPETVRDRAFAFDGTVESVETRVDPKLPTEGSQSQDSAWVTFKVNQWFKGGESPDVEVWVDPHTPEGGWLLEPGVRLLVAGEYRWGQPPEDPLAWGCGFTQPYTPEAASQWADAMPAP